ncbi:mechanosensitive ion channel family protein [Staphylococcus massiliensis]|uniref:Transporter, small conductance mechanosensitive ion channel (MscS) family protein n=1 Tax=Staphylococcus massiliensis S46 TaxID=1229783 RepID=K9B319_9STAP|nr:mechanosensitive ion channel family protein [Staphylococcus massiliensis]EKU48180.1 transporter, small conductance mechanosensitive ion channel (MscS) family protein [Staphylococcus massiliensis S46]MCG3402069.1 mechanosensitive ion channel family protein [Staphylococcus massiliensis]MCG3412980.1 mechanosensitive ion channel family protein [Staphylococcus massiliensis]POA00993.1 mechanosensitive ion channel family protein [Staphylococcus massiliensis CCUG 55927]
MVKQIENIFKGLIEPLTKPETYEQLITKLIIIAIYIIVAFILTRIVNKVIAQFFKMNKRNKNYARAKRSETLITLVQNVVGYIIWFITITTILGKFGVSVEGILAGAGVVGLAIGFGAQTLVKDIITGFFIIFENQFDVGDYVKINTSGATVAEGFIKSIGLRSTRLTTFSGELVILPNGTINEVVNYSVSNNTSVVEMPFSAEEDITKVETLLSEFLPKMRKEHDVFTKDPIVLGVERVTSLEIVIKITAETIPGEGFAGARILRREIKEFFQREGIKPSTPAYVSYDPNRPTHNA